MSGRKAAITVGGPALVGRRAVVLGGLATVALSACGFDQASGGASADRGPVGEFDGEGPSALRNPDADGLPDPLIDTDRLISGGPGPDGIPSIDDPRFLPVGDVGDLADTELVVGVEIDGSARAYPIAIMIWHEIVNDTIEQTPVAVTYCPLCNSALAFDRRVLGRTLTFGVSGLLFNSDLVMFDRQTESLWPQIEGKAVAGVLTGAELERFTAVTQPWAAWRDAHPDGEVLTRDTGYSRDYGRNPYPGYDDAEASPFLYRGDIDERMPPKTRVIGLRSGDDAVVVSLADVEQRRVIELTVDGAPTVLFAGPEAASPLDASDVAQGRPRATVRAFRPRAAGKDLRFRAAGVQFIDDATSSRWDANGLAIDGELAGTRLAAVEALETLWFAWIAFQPQTRVLD